MITEKATAVSYATNGGAFLLGLAFNDWLALGGFILMVLTFVVNWVYRAREDRRAERVSQAKIEAMNNKK